MEGMVAMTELLMAGPLDPNQARYVGTLHQTTRRLLGVLADILDFARLEAGRFKLERKAFDLHDLIQGVGSVLQTRANEKGLTGGLDIGANCPQFVTGDHARLRQVLLSLVDNALKFTAHGSIRLHVSASEVDGRLLLRFDVTDTGVGLSKATQERLFQPFVQIESKVGGNAGGTGLGLSIARKLAMLMGGEIGCESVVGQGTHYWFVLPAERARPAAAPAPKERNEAPPQGTLSGHVLVVEDNAVNRMLIVTYLDEFGLSYEVVSSGGAAIMNLATKDYDLVMVDTGMPDLDGVEIARRIRAMRTASSNAPIVALIAHGRTADCGAYLAAGMDAYVTKPIRGRELHAVLAPFLGGGKEEPILRLVKG
jgi:CheY-like chemotaxis protein